MRPPGIRTLLAAAAAAPVLVVPAAQASGSPYSTPQSNQAAAQAEAARLLALIQLPPDAPAPCPSRSRR